jgi:hypothetical protein
MFVVYVSNVFLLLLLLTCRKEVCRRSDAKVGEVARSALRYVAVAKLKPRAPTSSYEATTTIPVAQGRFRRLAEIGSRPRQTVSNCTYYQSL